MQKKCYFKLSVPVIAAVKNATIVLQAVMRSTVLQQSPVVKLGNRDYFMVGECVRFLFTSCEGSLNEE